jgi:hypothetical protein
MNSIGSMIQKAVDEMNPIPPCAVTKEARQEAEAMLYDLPRLCEEAERAGGVDAALVHSKIARIKAALEYVSNDPLYKIIPAKYFHRATDRATGSICCCEKTTVWRNRRRILDVLALRLLGVSAWEKTKNL